MKLEINHRKTLKKNTNMWRLNNILLKQPVEQRGNQTGSKNYLETNGNETPTLENLLGHSKSSYKRKVYSYTHLPQEAGENHK